MEALSEWGAPTLAINEVNKALRFVQNFGFHLAHLDVRQNSEFYQKAFIGLLEDVDTSSFSMNADGSVDKTFLLQELNRHRPFIYDYPGNVREPATGLG